MQKYINRISNNLCKILNDEMKKIMNEWDTYSLKYHSFI